MKIRMRVETGTPLLTRIDSLAEREARRERAQNKKAQARHEQIRAAGGTVDRAVADRCMEDAAVGRVRERTAARRIAALGSLAEARVDLDRRPGDPPRREVVVHVDADVLADDTAAGRAFFEGGPAITGAQARRMLCEATAVVMLEKGREPLAVGRRKRRATKAQRRALLRRDGGCARPGCPETRIERLHAHHMRHWLFGGRTELANLVLLCDADHGLVHDHDLVLSRRERPADRPDPRRPAHLGHRRRRLHRRTRRPRHPPDRRPRRHRPFIGVHPIDDRRRPTPHRRTPARPARLDRRSAAAAAGRLAAADPPHAPPTRDRAAPAGRPANRRSGRRRRIPGDLPGRTGTGQRPPQPRPLPRRRTTAPRLPPASATTA